jgi:hypothetical protein
MRLRAMVVVCMWLCGGSVLVKRVGVERECGVEELKWDVCSQQGQRLALDPKESKCSGVSHQLNGRHTRHINVPVTIAPELL